MLGLSHWSVHVAFRVLVVGYFSFRSEQPFHYSILLLESLILQFSFTARVIE